MCTGDSYIAGQPAEPAESTGPRKQPNDDEYKPDHDEQWPYIAHAISFSQSSPSTVADFATGSRGLPTLVLDPRGK